MKFLSGQLGVLCAAGARAGEFDPAFKAGEYPRDDRDFGDLAAGNCNGESGGATPAERTRYRWSIAAAIAANAADAASSGSQQEGNPVVVRGGAQFGATSIAIKSGFVATSLVIQHIVLRHRPDLYKKLAWLNFGIAKILGGVAHYNIRVR